MKSHCFVGRGVRIESIGMGWFVGEYIHNVHYMKFQKVIKYYFNGLKIVYNKRLTSHLWVNIQRKFYQVYRDI